MSAPHQNNSRFLLALAFILFVATSASSAMAKACDSCVAEKFASCGSGKFIEGPAFDRTGTLWLTALASGELLNVNAQGACEVVVKLDAGPNGLRWAGDMILIMDKRGRVLRHEPGKKQTDVLVSEFGGRPLRGLNDAALDAQGGVYFTESYGSHAMKQDGRVFYMALDKTSGEFAPPKLIGDVFAFPNGVALSPNEKRLYVADFSNRRIIAVPLAAPGVVGTGPSPYVFATLPDGGMGPDGLTVDGKGNVYAAHYGTGKVEVFDNNGFSIGAISLPADAGVGVTNMAIRDGFLYITESTRNEVWRAKLTQ